MLGFYEWTMFYVAIFVTAFCLSAIGLFWIQRSPHKERLERRMRPF